MLKRHELRSRLKDFSTVGLGSSPVSGAPAGLRANQARYFKFDHTIREESPDFMFFCLPAEGHHEERFRVFPVGFHELHTLTDLSDRPSVSSGRARCSSCGDELKTGFAAHVKFGQLSWIGTQCRGARCHGRNLWNVPLDPTAAPY